MPNLATDLARVMEFAKDQLQRHVDMLLQECDCEECPECGKLPHECSGTTCAQTCQCTTCDHCLATDAIDGLTDAITAALANQQGVGAQVANARNARRYLWLKENGIIRVLPVSSGMMSRGGTRILADTKGWLPGDFTYVIDGQTHDVDAAIDYAIDRAKPTQPAGDVGQHPAIWLRQGPPIDVESAASLTGNGLVIAMPAAESPRPMETAPRDGTMVRLLVEFIDHAIEDCVGPAWTIGANNDDNVGDDERTGWQFAGWCWTHDHFTNGLGMPVGWLPLAPEVSDA